MALPKRPRETVQAAAQTTTPPNRGGFTSAGARSAVIYGVMALRLPESPRYLVAKGDVDTASQVLLDFTGEPDVNLKIEQIRTSLEREERESMRDLRGPALGLRPIVWIGILLSAFQQFVGNNVIFYYSTTLWRSVGMTLALGAMAVAFTFGELKPGADGSQSVVLGQPWATIALISANLFVIAFGATWEPVVWVLLGEMFPNRIRASALAVAAAAQWLTNVAISTTFPLMADVGLTFAYGFYAVCAALSFVFVLWKVPETRGT